MKAPQLYSPANNPSARRLRHALEDCFDLLDEVEDGFDPRDWLQGISRPAPALMEEHSIFASLSFE